MKRNYVSLSLETHLFFCRIMKEHALFLLAGFPSKNAEHIKKADWFRRQFEALLRETVLLSNTRVGKDILQSGEIVTMYTMQAEQRTSFLTGIEINSRITARSKSLQAGCEQVDSREIRNAVRRLNNRALHLVNGLISFKEQILKEMCNCRLFTFNYPLLIEHILREAKLYRSFLVELETNGTISKRDALEMENFWNQIMMEHALFIRGLLDPCEETLIDTADNFAQTYKKLLEEAKNKDRCACEELEKRTIKETLKYRDFKAAGTKGITECKISGLILPLLADHVLREANHYLRLLNADC